MRFFVRYGCYIQDGAECVEASSKEIAEEYARDQAYQTTDGCVGTHGFADEDPDDFDSEEEYNEYIHEEIEWAVDYVVEPWNEEKHAPKCTFGGNSTYQVINLG